MNLFWGTTDVPESKYRMLSLIITAIPLLFALFYPKVGSILGYAASVSGFFMIYVVPVFAYLKVEKLKITQPLLVAAMQENEVEIYVPSDKKAILPKNIEDAPGEQENLIPPPSFSMSPKMVISDRFLKRQKIVDKHAK